MDNTDSGTSTLSHWLRSGPNSSAAPVRNQRTNARATPYARAPGGRGSAATTVHSQRAFAELPAACDVQGPGWPKPVPCSWWCGLLVQAEGGDTLSGREDVFTFAARAHRPPPVPSIRRELSELPAACDVQGHKAGLCSCPVQLWLLLQAEGEAAGGGRGREPKGPADKRREFLSWNRPVTESI